MEKNFHIMDNRPKSVYGDNERYPHRAAHGKTTEMVRCPFCEKKTMAYTWSLAGGGKKCDYCKDTIHFRYSTEKRFKTAEAAQIFLKENI